MCDITCESSWDSKEELVSYQLWNRSILIIRDVNRKQEVMGLNLPLLPRVKGRERKSFLSKAQSREAIDIAT
jgi:hypothetical protein